jgi:hypothetical protein
MPNIIIMPSAPSMLAPQALKPLHEFAVVAYHGKFLEGCKHLVERGLIDGAGLGGQSFSDWGHVKTISAD